MSAKCELVTYEPNENSKHQVCGICPCIGTRRGRRKIEVFHHNAENYWQNKAESQRYEEPVNKQSSKLFVSNTLLFLSQYNFISIL